MTMDGNLARRHRHNEGRWCARVV